MAPPTLAQVVDLFEQGTCTALFIVGMIAPAAGWALSWIVRELANREAAGEGAGVVVALFYALTLPLGWMFFFGGETSGALPACSFLLLTPFGVILALVLPLRAAVQPARARAVPWTGLCPACGYDLRATPQRCPECGSVPSPKAATDDQREEPVADGVEGQPRSGRGGTF